LTELLYSVEGGRGISVNPLKVEDVVKPEDLNLILKNAVSVNSGVTLLGTIGEHNENSSDYKL